MLNINLITEISNAKSLQKIGNNRFDKDGNVIRDHKAELQVYQEIENTSTLSCIPLSFFDGCRKLAEHLRLRK